MYVCQSLFSLNCFYFQRTFFEKMIQSFLECHGYLSDINLVCVVGRGCPQTEPSQSLWDLRQVLIFYFYIKFDSFLIGHMLRNYFLATSIIDVILAELGQCCKHL